MNKQRVLDLLKKQSTPYTGDGSLASVKSYVEAQGIELVGADNAPLNLDALWTDKKAVKVEAEPAPQADPIDTTAIVKSIVDGVKASMPTPGTAIGQVKDRVRDDRSLGYGDFETGFGRFMADVCKASTHGVSAASEIFQKGVATLSRKAASGMGENNDSLGGFLVPVEFQARLLEKVYENSAVVSRAQQIPMGAKQVQLPAINETSRANGSRSGGVTGYWDGEGDTISTSTPGLARVTLTANALTVGVRVTDELLADSAISLPPVINRLASDEIGFKLQDAFINGTGAGQPLGVLNAGCVVSVAKETGQAAATIVYENVVKMWARLWGRSMQNAVWFVNQDAMPQLMLMSLPVGTGGLPVMLPPGGASASPYGTIFGRPLIPIEQCATLGTVGDIVLADMGEYLYGLRQGVQSAESMHVRFEQREMSYRFVMRADGQPWWNSALTPFKGSNTQSPFVTLATRS